jgi:N-methylhydantoinase A/oxoprolinase/acetone carboxylase beta subunit
MPDLLLGIDTGGTYTDGVLLDAASRAVLQTTKTLTTHHDLRLCILDALDALLPDDRSRISLVAISTTLATNAIAEGKGRPVGLFLLGYDRDLVRRFRFAPRFATARHAYIAGGHTLYGRPQEPLALTELVMQARAWEADVEAFAVSGYFSPLNPEHEEAAFTALQEATDHPVVLGHQLASRLNSVERATTATLNASLLSILQGFVEAMEAALRERQVTAPLLVMRGDGALMNGPLAARRPVETVHSGPAASAGGGAFLSQLDRALVVDIGGTTTDLAVIDGGLVRVREDGTSVGPYRTAVRAADVRSIGLGGDSFLGLDAESRLTVGPERVVPLAYLAHHYPHVRDALHGLDFRLRRRPTPDHIEFWFMQRAPRRLPGPRASEALTALQDGPLALPELLRRLDLLHPLQFEGPSLVAAGVVGRSALTPTDLLHLTGDYAPWDAEVAQIGAELLAHLSGSDVAGLVESTMTIIAERITAEIVSFLSGQTLTRLPGNIRSDNLGRWLFEENVSRAHPYLGATIHLKMPLVGIGAPAHIFLPRVAALLDAELVLPPYHQVANAVGAVAGTITVTREAWIYPEESGRRIGGYVVQGPDKRRRFGQLAEALDYAEAMLAAEVRDTALAQGASSRRSPSSGSPIVRKPTASAPPPPRSARSRPAAPFLPIRPSSDRRTARRPPGPRSLNGVRPIACFNRLNMFILRPLIHKSRRITWWKELPANRPVMSPSCSWQPARTATASGAGWA